MSDHLSNQSNSLHISSNSTVSHTFGGCGSGATILYSQVKLFLISSSFHVIELSHSSIHHFIFMLLSVH